MTRTTLYCTVLCFAGRKGKIFCLQVNEANRGEARRSEAKQSLTKITVRRFSVVRSFVRWIGRSTFRYFFPSRQRKKERNKKIRGTFKRRQSRRRRVQFMHDALPKCEQISPKPAPGKIAILVAAALFGTKGRKKQKLKTSSYR